MHKRALKEERQWRLSGLVALRRDDLIPPGFGEGLGGMVLLCLAIIVGVSVMFVVIKHAAFWLIPAALPSALLLGFLLHFLLGIADRYWDRLVSRSGNLHTAFLLFFLYLPVFVVLFYFILAYPLGMVLTSHALPELADDYRRWILDMAAVSALVAWGRLVFRKM